MLIYTYLAPERPEKPEKYLYTPVASRLDYCSSLYAGLRACRLGCLDRVLRFADRLIVGIPKFGHFSKYMLDVLRWLSAALLSSGFDIGLLPWSGVAYFALLLFTFVSSVVLSIVL